VVNQHRDNRYDMHEWKQTFIRKSFYGISDRSYPFQLDVAAKQLELP